MRRTVAECRFAVVDCKSGGAGGEGVETGDVHAGCVPPCLHTHISLEQAPGMRVGAAQGSCAAPEKGLVPAWLGKNPR